MLFICAMCRVFTSRWTGLIIVVAALAVAGFIALGYRQWPDIHKNCTPYQCDWIIDEDGSGCDNEGHCVYYWFTVVDGYVSDWDWGQINQEGDGAIATNTTTFLYPNGTVCYRPVNCQTSKAPYWVEDGYCQPAFECTNSARVDGRLAYTLLTSISMALIFFTAFGCWWRGQHIRQRYQYAIIQ